MRIFMCTYGSRGDVQPFVALGKALRAAGHTPILAAPARFATFAAAYGIDFVPLPGDVETLARQIADEARNRPLRLIGIVYRFALPLGVEVARRLQRAAANADMIIHTFLTVAIGHLYAQQYGISEWAVDLFPFFDPPDEIANIMWPHTSMGPRRRRLSHRFAHTVFQYSQQFTYRMLRQRAPDIGPPRLSWAMPGRQIPLLLAYSSALVPPGTGPLTVQTGSWHLEHTDWQPPPDLRAFLASGPPPVVVSFGSMATRDAPQLMQVVLSALRQTGQRGIIQRGWARLELADRPNDIYLADELPHDWLLPQAAAMIHHGGAGTTATALRAGIPAIIIPFAADQPFWAWRAHLTGANPPPIPPSELSVARLCHALEQALSPEQRRRAANISAQMQLERGVVAAVEQIERRNFETERETRFTR
ncbi:MAG: glycosyl transferase [Chloroflexus sp.]|uniref:glycosyltransferase n=1 Tax=Chloroflexus sp. TaxID=1904827 RepID=UPI0021DC32F5|nr:glycosyltransferase [Chloroflexus sp.]GIV87756.1 MAG: glycosyl transferase [Chloroflexus sp.]